MNAPYQPPPTVPVVRIDDTTHTGSAFWPRPRGYQPRHRADRNRRPDVRLVLDRDNNGDAA